MRPATKVGRTLRTTVDDSIISLDRFIQSTRDSGYKDTASAVAELVDNALQANATRVDIRLATASGGVQGDMRLAVADNGHGMAPDVLLQSLRFGGSTRFGDRSGLGRFGMGLPNASLSQAQRVTVFSWQGGAEPYSTYLDVDEIARGGQVVVPAPKREAVPEWTKVRRSRSGTVVVWERCDRIDHRRVSTILRKLSDALGQTFRYFLWQGAGIAINGGSVSAIDPLFLNRETQIGSATRFGDPMEIEVFVSETAQDADVGKVQVTFAELPVAEWHGFSNDEKRRLGIANRAGVSIVRADREIDYGWFFMGSKRRENYDDWWRCEVRFDPLLDEAFGITHTKQQVRPKAYLTEALQAHMEATAKALNARARQAYTQIKAAEIAHDAEVIAKERSSLLRPLPVRSVSANDDLNLVKVVKRNAVLREYLSQPSDGGTRYKIIQDEFADSALFRPIFAKSAVVSALNPRHPFYRRIYEPLADGRTVDPTLLLRAIQLLLLSASRAELMVRNETHRKAIEEYRKEWSAALDVMMR